MKIKIASRFFQSSISKYNLVELAQYMASFYFNARTVHFNTSGKNFLEIHEYAEELYEQAEDFYDDLVETALSFNEKVQPMFVTPGDFEMLKQETFAPEQSVEKLSDNVKRLFDIFESANKEIYPSFVYSKLDSIMEWLDKQNYKIEQMKKGETIQSSKQIKSSTWNDKSFAENIVDELNKYADRTYNDADSEFTKKYGKLFNFKYRVEDDGTVVIYDNQGALDLFDEDSSMTEFIRKKCKEMGGYCEPYDSSASFTIGEV